MGAQQAVGAGAAPLALTARLNREPLSGFQIVARNRKTGVQ